MWSFMMTSFQLLGFSFSRCLERCGRLAPESIEPSTQRLDPPRVHRIEPACALGAIDNQSCRLENLQMLGDGGTAHVHPFGDLSHGASTAAQPLEHQPAG